MTGPIAKSTIRTSFVLGLRLVVQAGTLLIVARMLGPHQFGAFAGIAALAVILGTLSTFGTHLVLLGEVSKEPDQRNGVLQYALPTTLITGSTLLAIYLAICLLLLREPGVSLYILLSLGVTETLLQPLILLCTMEHHGLGRIALSQLLRILALGFRLTAAAVVFGLHINNPLNAYAYGYALASLVALAVILRTLPQPWPSASQWRLPFRKELNEAAGYAVINLTQVGPAELDKTLAAKLLPLATAGVYAAGARVIGAITLPVNAMTASALPRLFREGQKQPQRSRSLVLWMVWTALAYSAVLAAVLWAAAPAFDWVFGAKFHGLSSMIRWLCIAIPGMALRQVAGNALMALGMPRIRAGIEAFGLVALAVASVILTAHLGFMGMPLALAFSEWGMAITATIFLWWCHKRTINKMA